MKIAVFTKKANIIGLKQFAVNYKLYVCNIFVEVGLLEQKVNDIINDI